MICPKCGATLREDALFCQKCGEKIVEVKTEAPVQATPVMAAPEMRKEAPTEIPAPKKAKWSWKKKILVSIVIIVVALGSIIFLNKKTIADYIYHDIVFSYKFNLSEDGRWALIRVSAWLGDPRACYSVSQGYLHGRFISEDYVTKDVQKAIFWHEKYIIYGWEDSEIIDINKNNPVGARELKLAIDYDTGWFEDNSFPKNSQKALEWYQIAADKGNEVAKSIIRAGGLTKYISQSGAESRAPYLTKSYYLSESQAKDLSKYLPESTEQSQVASNTTERSSTASIQIPNEEFLVLCRGGSPQEINAAIKGGSNVNAKLDAAGRTPLMIAAVYNSNSDVITALVEAGADINAKGENGYTALAGAAGYNSNPYVIRTLIEAGADVNAQDVEGDTALMWAAEHAGKTASPEAILILLRFGADATLKDQDGKTALDYAMENDSLQNTDALQQLRAASSSGQASGSSSSAEMPETSDLQYAIITGNNVNVRSAPNTSGRVLFQMSQSNNDYLVIEKTPTQDSSGGNWYRVVYRWLEYEESGGDYDSVDEPTYINGNFFRAQVLPVEDRDMYMLFSEREREARQASYR